MVTKDPTTWTWATWSLAIMMSFAGGFLNWWSKVQAGHTRVVNIVELVGEMAVAGIVGLIAFMTADGLDQSASICAVAAGIGGHMGTRLLFLAEQWAIKRLGSIK